MHSPPKDFTKAIDKAADEQNRLIVSLAAISVVDVEMHIHVMEGDITDDGVYSVCCKSASVKKQLHRASCFCRS